MTLEQAIEKAAEALEIEWARSVDGFNYSSLQFARIVIKTLGLTEEEEWVKVTAQPWENGLGVRVRLIGTWDEVDA